MEKAKAMLERIKFEEWARTEGYDMRKFTETTDFSGLPVYTENQTYDTWAGWFARAELEIKS